MLDRSRGVLPRTAGASPQHSSSARVPNEADVNCLEFVELRRKRTAPVSSTADSIACRPAALARCRAKPATVASRRWRGVSLVGSRGVVRRRQAEEQGGKSGDRGCEPYDATVEYGSRKCRLLDREGDRRGTRHPNARTRVRRVSSDTSTAPSVRSCRTRRPRLAPIARRTAISLRRALARAVRRLATFAHPISRTSATIAMMISSGSE